MKTSNTNKELAECVNMGLAFGELGHYQEAAVSLRKAIELDPADADIRFGLAVALFLCGDKISALEQYLILRRIDRKLGYELYNLLSIKH